MNRKTILGFIVPVILFVLLFILSFFMMGALLTAEEEVYTVSVRVRSEISDSLYLYTGSEPAESGDTERTGISNPSRYSVADVRKAAVTAGESFKTFTFTVKGDSIGYLMLRFGSRNNVMWYIEEIRIESLLHKRVIDSSVLPEVFGENDGISKLSEKDGGFCSLKTIGTKPVIAVTEGSPITVTQSRPTLFFLSVGVALILTALVMFVISVIRTGRLSISFEPAVTAVALSAVAVSPFIFGLSAVAGMVLAAVAALCILILVIFRIKEHKKAVKTDLLSLLTAVLILVVFSAGSAIALFTPGIYENSVAFLLAGATHYPSDVMKTFEENYPLSEIKENFYETLKTEVLGDSLNENVIIGKDGWLFPSSTLADYKKTNSFSSATLKEMIENIELYDKIMLNNGAVFYFMPVPDKMTVYSRYMPDNIKSANRISRIDGVYLDFYKYSDIRVVEIKDKLTEKAAADDGLYYKADSFITQKGAAAVIDTLETYILKDFESYEPISVPQSGKEVHALTGLADIMETSDGYASENEELFFSGTDGMTVTVGRTDENGEPMENEFSFSESVSEALEERDELWQLNDYFVIDNPNAANDMTAVIMRDEGGFSTVPYYCRMFSRCIVMTDRKARTQLLIALEPDIVIYEVSENNLGTIAD